MKKKKKPLLLLTLGFILTTVGVYFLVKKPDLKADFIYTRFPSIAGVSTTLLNDARSVIPHGLPTLTNLFSNSSADTNISNPLQQLNDEVKNKIDYLKNSLIEAGLEKIGYTPISKQDVANESPTPSPCIEKTF